MSPTAISNDNLFSVRGKYSRRWQSRQVYKYVTGRRFVDGKTAAVLNVVIPNYMAQTVQS